MDHLTHFQSLNHCTFTHCFHMATDFEKNLLRRCRCCWPDWRTRTTWWTRASDSTTRLCKFRNDILRKSPQQHLQQPPLEWNGKFASPLPRRRNWNYGLNSCLVSIRLFLSTKNTWLTDWARNETNFVRDALVAAESEEQLSPFLRRIETPNCKTTTTTGRIIREACALSSYCIIVYDVVIRSPSCRRGRRTICLVVY